MSYFTLFYRHLMVTLATIVCLSPGMADGQDAFRYPEARHGKGELRYQDSIAVLRVRGSHAEMGEQIGVLALKPAKRAIELIEGFAQQHIPAALRPIANAAMNGMYQKFPLEYRQELEAMAKNADVPIASLIMANTIIDLQELIGCSSVMVSAEHSTTGGPLYGRNMDLPYVEGLAEFSLLIVYEPDEGHAFAMPNLPGFLMLASGMNEHGLALGSQSVGPPADQSPRFEPNGIASAVAGRRLIERCDDVVAVQSWLEANPLARCVSIAACDVASHAVYEVTTNRVLMRHDEGICCATNHFRAAELAGDTSCRRYARLEQLSQSKAIDVRALQQVLHEVHQGELTVHSMVFETKVRKLHLAIGRGPITEKPYTTIDLTGYFRRD